MRIVTLDLDVSATLTAMELHALLSDRLGFPKYYGRNWDAFEECVRDPEQSEFPTVLRIHGWDTLRERLKSDAEILREVLEQLSSQRSDVTIEWL